jgi:hypothetical protein
MHPHIHEEADTVTLRDVMRVSVRIYLNPKAGHSTSATLKDVLFLNFPAVRDIHQLRGLLTGTPLCEILGSSRSAIHRQGTLIDFGALDGQRDLAEATRAPLPSHVDTPLLGERTDGTDGDTWCIFECSGDVKTADGTQDQERVRVQESHCLSPCPQTCLQQQKRGRGEPIPPPAQLVWSY